MSRDYAKMNVSQRQALLDLLLDLGWHVHAELAGAAGVRYSARILELKRLGYDISSEEISEQGKRYKLESHVQGTPQGKKVKIFLDENDASDLLLGRVTPATTHAVCSALTTFRINRDKL